MLGLGAFVGPALLGPAADAHELAIDELRLWKTPVEVAVDGAVVRGQLIFDPELTRSLQEPLDVAVHGARVQRWVTEQLQLAVDERPCSLQLEARELYELGGAAPGDVVMVTCAAASDPASVTVSVGTGLSKLLVTVIGSSAASSGVSTVLLHGGESERFSFVSPADGGSAARHTPAVPPQREPSPGHRVVASHLSLLAFLFAGVSHIVPHGLDHLLFMLVLALHGYRHVPRAIGLTGVFTLAHTASVAWSWFGGVLPSPRWVGPLITGTLAAAGFAVHQRLRGGPTLPVVALCGMIHGLGFAGSLTPSGLQGAPRLAAILGFNVGVELTHLGVLVTVVLSLRGLSRLTTFESGALETHVRWASFSLGLLGVLWTVERVLG